MSHLPPLKNSGQQTCRPRALRPPTATFPCMPRMISRVKTRLSVRSSDSIGSLRLMAASKLALLSLLVLAYAVQATSISGLVIDALKYPLPDTPSIPGLALAVSPSSLGRVPLAQCRPLEPWNDTASPNWLETEVLPSSDTLEMTSGALSMKRSVQSLFSTLKDRVQTHCAAVPETPTTQQNTESETHCQEWNARSIFLLFIAALPALAHALF
ncbi:hypothetical protein BC834DRAFT_858255 [Gloeopeniophorella convolvens]|nr:hypothetical protein BC834DRAFT_858255 [Gloeopeniophorella convolvens]